MNKRVIVSPAVHPRLFDETVMATPAVYPRLFEIPSEKKRSSVAPVDETTKSDPSTGDQLRKRRAETWPGRVRRSLVEFRSPAAGRMPKPGRSCAPKPCRLSRSEVRPAAGNGPARPGPAGRTARWGPVGSTKPGPARLGRRRERDGKTVLGDGRDHLCM